MENLEKLLGTLQEQHFTFNYGKNQVEINLDTLLSNYEDGTSFIDYLSDFYYVQSVYDKLNHDTDPSVIFQDLSENSESFYKLLSLIKFYYSELKNCLYEIKDGGKFRCPMHFRTYIEPLYTSYSYIKINSSPYLDKEDNYINIYIESNLEEKNKILTYFIKQYDVGLNPILKLVLLRIILEILINDRENFELKKQSLEKFLGSFSDNLNNLTSKFQSTLNRDDSNQMFCWVSVDNNNWFGQMIKNSEFSNAMNTLNRKNRRKLNCYAIAYRIDIKRKEILYYAINNMDGDDRKTLHKIFSKLLNGIDSAMLTNEVRYYLTDEKKYINYNQFANYRYKRSQSHTQTIDNSYNRMFTCCERKIFAKLRCDKKNYASILVTQPPCVYCSRELNHIKNNPSIIININYPGLEGINTHDSLAQYIFNLNNPKG